MDSTFKNIPPANSDSETGVSSINGADGSVTIVPGTNVTIDTNGTVITVNSTGSGGDVVGPGSSTATAIPVFTNTTGKLLSNSSLLVNSKNLTVDSSGIFSINGFVNGSGNGSDLTLRGGNSTGGLGGNLTINAGNTQQSGAGAPLQLTGGSNTVGAGGTTIVAAGTSSAAGQSGGQLDLRGGRPGSGGTPGNIRFGTGTSAGGLTRLNIDGLGNVIMGTAALATTATDGFFNLTSSAGAPTGVPTTFTGRVPIHYDTTGDLFYVYNGSWKIVGGTNLNTVLQGGNSFGTNMSIGTTDAEPLTFITNGESRLSVDPTLPLLSVPDSDTSNLTLEFRGGKGVSPDIMGGYVALTGGLGTGTATGGNVYLNSGSSETGIAGNVEFLVGSQNVARFTDVGTLVMDAALGNRNVDPPLNIAGQMRVFLPATSTPNATPKSALTYATFTDTVEQWEVRVKARDNSTGDCACFFLNVMVKNQGGTVTVTDIVSNQAADVGAITWTCAVVPSGTDALIQVTGAAATTITWDGALTIT